MAFGERVTAGLALYNVKFRNQRIAYEISLQEAGAFYRRAPPPPRCRPAPVFAGLGGHAACGAGVCGGRAAARARA